MLAVVFDLDGTLIDSAPDIAAVLNRILAADGHAALSLDEVRGMIGDGARQLLERGFAARGATAEPRHLEAFIADYQENPVRETVCYPGMEEALASAAGRGTPARAVHQQTRRPDHPYSRRTWSHHVFRGNYGRRFNALQEAGPAPSGRHSGRHGGVERHYDRRPPE